MLRPVLLAPLLMLALLVAPAAAGAQGEGVCPSGADTTTARRAPDLLLRATVRAAEVRFGSPPRVAARTTGCAAVDSVRVLERRNLPSPVQPGRTYRDVEVTVEIRSYLNVDCLLASAGAAAAGADSLRTRSGALRLCGLLGADTLRRAPVPRR